MGVHVSMVMMRMMHGEYWMMLVFYTHRHGQYGGGGLLEDSIRRIFHRYMLLRSHCYFHSRIVVIVCNAGIA
jgi:hypothetical protein